MKKNILKIIAVVFIAAMISSVFSLTMVSHSEGSDPLITLSYLTEIILPQFKTDIVSEFTKNKNTSEEEQLTENITPDTDTTVIPDDASVSDVQPDTQNVPQPSANGTYTLLELTYGQCVYAMSVLEIIVRPGSDVLTISPFENQGIADITGTKEYLNGDTLDINSYCIIPRGGDGRGIYVNNEKSYILVRGEYYIG